MTLAAASPAFLPLPACWVCGGLARRRTQRATFELSAYRDQDAELAALTGAAVWLVRCDGCGFAQPEAVPAVRDYFARLYDTRWSAGWLAAEFASPYRDRIFRTVLARLDPPAGRLLDVGCHIGRFLRLAAIAGWDAEGVEPNPTTAGFAAAHAGRPIRRELPAGRRFDAVTLLDVLEHVPDPVPFLRDLRGLLPPGGRLVVKVPHGPAQLLKERLRGRLRPGSPVDVAGNLVHVGHFTPPSLRHALTRAGFTDIALSPAPPEDAPTRIGTVVRAAAHAVARALPGAVRTPLALHLLAVARAA